MRRLTTPLSSRPHSVSKITLKIVSGLGCLFFALLYKIGTISDFHDIYVMREQGIVMNFSS